MRIVIPVVFALLTSAAYAAPPPPPVSPVTNPAPIDGSGHNALDPNANKAGTAEKRFFPAIYPDTNGDIPVPGPNAREISNIVYNNDGQPDVPNPFNANGLVWMWGVFVDHDLGISTATNGTPSTAGNIDITIPVGDPVFTPGDVIPIDRFAYAPGTGALGVPRASINVTTGWIDTSQVYGYGQDLSFVPGYAGTTPNVLREGFGGLLKTSAGNLPPRAPVALGPGFPPDLFVCGDFFPRCNENVGLTMFHTLMIREHNRKVAEYALANPGLTDEQLFQLGRQWVRSLMQSITYNEFLPTILGPNPLPKYTGHKPTTNGRLAEEFVGATYRFGHSLLTAVLEQGDGKPAIPLEDTLFQGSGTFLVSSDIDAFVRGALNQRHAKLDCIVAPGVRNALVVDVEPNPPGQPLDLPAINTVRGRDLGLPLYNDVREMVGLPRVQQFSEAFDPDAAGRLQTAYGSPDNVELFPGVICERRVNNSQMGPTGKAILVKQFTDLRDADAYWYQNVLNKKQQKEVEKYDLATLIQNNTALSKQEIGPHAFKVHGN